MTPPGIVPAVSLIIPNRDRPRLLERVLRGVSHLRYPHFEVIVVGDRAHVAEYGLPSRLARGLRYFQCTEANISMARNIGIRAARGEIVAFCDDDAVPEPDWLDELVVPFAASGVGAVGGCVRGEDGVQVQWCGALCDLTGAERPLLGSGRTARIFDPDPDAPEFPGLMGVNTAFRRSALLDIGGFDESFRYFLDETDAALRLTRAGWRLALAPDAEVHHFSATNASRGRLRQPRSFAEIGASKAYFAYRHTPRQWLEETLETFLTQKCAEMDPYVRLGLLTGRARRRLERELVDGFCRGLERRAVLPLRAGDRPFGAFTPYRGQLGQEALSIAVVAGWGVRHGWRMRRLAVRLGQAGHRVSLVQFRSGAAAPEVRFSHGIWMHGGGTWRVARDGPRLRVLGRAARAEAEVERVSPRRGFDLVLAQRSLTFGWPDGLHAALPGLPAPLAVYARDGAGEMPVLLGRLAEALAPAASWSPEAGSAHADGNLRQEPGS